MQRITFALFSLAIVAMVGCAQQQYAHHGGSTAGTPIAPLPTSVQSEPNTLHADLSNLPNYQTVDQALNQPTVPVQYGVLPSCDAQCLAAANAPLAKLYDAERCAVLANADCRTQSAACVLSRLMAYRAVDERNKAAASALELFYALAEAEANHDILNRGVDEVDRASANLEELKKSGLKVPVDASALQRQKLDWLDRRIQLDAATAKLRPQLQQICGIEDDPTTPIWPQADMTVTVMPIDLPSAIAQGLANRADLGALRMLHHSLNLETLPAARVGIQSISPGLGASIAARRMLGNRSAGDDEAELGTRQSQICQAWSELERNVRREITEAVQNVEARLREIAVAKERCDIWRQRIEDLKERRKTGGVTAFDLNAAQLEYIRAESDAIHRIIAWKTAQANLKKVQGLLAAECGYGPPN